MERAIPFRRIYNFRDLGGYPTGDGRTVAWRRLFRSDDLSRLTIEDADRFAALGIRTVIDLRRPTEIAEIGRIPEFTGVDYRHAHLVYPPWGPEDYADLAGRISYLTERYREMAVTGGEGIGLALRSIAEAEAAPLAVHCFVGMDRTGIVSALTLSLLGVPDEVVAAEYALSEAAVPALQAAHNIRLSRFGVTPAGAMINFLAALRSEHGSLEAYAKSIGVTDDHIAAMRAHLLTP
ncbi:MAG: tyrosine-protein phosphatase [Micromonosporaceae bacterium]|nr:tyrosine-protein phosphatase [Micromonosporaceae bacterium]